MTIGQRIAALRKQAGLSQEALAAQLNVSRQAIGKWEADASLPGLDNLQELARALGVSCDELLTGEKRPSAADQPAPLAGAAPSLEGIQALFAESEQRRQASQRRRNRRTLAAGVVLATAALLLLIHYASQMNSLKNQMNQVTNQLNGLYSSINSRIDSIEGNVQKSLEESTSLVADWSSQFGEYSEADGTISLTLTTLPKTVAEDTTALFRVQPSGGQEIEVPAQRQGSSFTAQVALPLCSDCTFSVGFTSGGVTQYQQLGSAYDLERPYRMDLNFYPPGWSMTYGFAPKFTVETLPIYGTYPTVTDSNGVCQLSQYVVSAQLEVYNGTQLLTTLDVPAEQWKSVNEAALNTPSDSVAAEQLVNGIARGYVWMDCTVFLNEQTISLPDGFDPDTASFRFVLLITDNNGRTTRLEAD